MPEIKINDRISYIPACEKPLSADVGIVRGDRKAYIFDVGSTVETLEFLHGLEGRCDIVVSHFHADHTWWLTEHHKEDKDVSEGDTISLTYVRPRYERLYVGSLTKKYIPDGEVISAPTIISSISGNNYSADERVIFESGSEYDGVKISVFPIPNSHCKGGLAMMVDDEYLFIGDSGYCMEKDGKATYNAQLLKAEIDLLEKVPADKLLISHDRKFVRDKAVLLRQMKTIYSHRSSGSPYITAE